MLRIMTKGKKKEKKQKSEKRKIGKLKVESRKEKRDNRKLGKRPSRFPFLVNESTQRAQKRHPPAQVNLQRTSFFVLALPR